MKKIVLLVFALNLCLGMFAQFTPSDTLKFRISLKDKALFLPLTDKKVKKAVVFKDQSPVRFTKSKAGILLEFAELPADIDYVVELTID